MKALLITTILFVTVYTHSVVSAETKRIYYLDRELDGEDISFSSDGKENTQGTLEIGDYQNRLLQSHIKWDVRSLPDNVAYVELLLYRLPNKPSYPAPFFNWFEMTSYWDSIYNPFDQFTGELIRTLPPPQAPSGWVRWNITSLYYDWKDGNKQNYGFGFGPALKSNKAMAFAGMEFKSKSIRPRLFVVTRDFKISFPVKGLSPFTTRCTATFDNDRLKNGRVKAYNGFVASDIAVPYGKITAYKNKNMPHITLPLLNYDDEVGDPNKNDTLFYDGHNGYDYAEDGKVKEGTQICAAASGLLVAATATTTPNGGVWREKKIVVPGGKDTLQWEKNHAFCILHEQNYSTWYLHASDFTPRLRLQLHHRVMLACREVIQWLM